MALKANKDYHRSAERIQSRRLLKEHEQPDSLDRQDKTRAYFVEEPTSWLETKAVYKFISSVIPPERNRYLAHILTEAQEANNYSTLQETLSLFWELEQPIAQRLIEQGQVDVVFMHAHHFQKFDKNLAAFLLEHDRAKTLTIFCYAFKGLDRTIANSLIAAGYGEYVLEAGRKFGIEEPDKALAQTLIAHNQVGVLANNLDYFCRNLDQDIALHLIQAGFARDVLDNVRQFKDFKLNDTVAQLLIDTKQGSALTEHYKEFSHFNTSNHDARSLVLAGAGDLVLDQPEIFGDVQLDKTVALELIANNCTPWLIEHIDRFVGLDYEVAWECLSHGSNVVLKNPQYFNMTFDVALFKHLLHHCQFTHDIKNDLEYFPLLDSSVVEDLIVAYQGRLLFECPDRFTGIHYDVALADQLIAHQQAHLVFTHLDQFSGLVFNADMAAYFIKANQGNEVVQHLDHFHGLNRTIGEQLVDNGLGYYVIEHVERFSGIKLDKAFAMRYLAYRPQEEEEEDYRGNFFIEKLDVFTGLDKDVALSLIKRGLLENVIQHADQFADLTFDKRLALHLIDMYYGATVVQYAERFENFKLDKTVAIWLITTGQSHVVIGYLDQFKELDKQTAHMLVHHGHGEAVIERAHYFQGFIFGNALAHELADAGQLGVLETQLKRFSGLDCEVALQLLGSKHPDPNLVFEQLRVFSELDQSVAERFIVLGLGNKVIEHAKRFHDLVFDRHLAQVLIQHYQSYLVTKNLDRFSNLDRTIAEQLIDNNEGSTVVTRSEYFADLVLDSSIAQRLLDHNSMDVLVTYLYDFSNLDRTIAEELINQRHGDVVIIHLETFPGVMLDSSIAQRLLDHNSKDVLVKYVDRFSHLNRDVAWRLVTANEGSLVLERKELFNDLAFDKALALHFIKNEQALDLLKGLEQFSQLDLEVGYRLCLVVGPNNFTPRHLAFFPASDQPNIIAVQSFQNRYNNDQPNIYAAYVQGRLPTDAVLETVLQDNLFDRTQTSAKQFDQLTEGSIKKILRDSESELTVSDELILTEANWPSLLIVYIRTSIEDNVLPEPSAEVAEKVKKLFEQDETKQFCYERLRAWWDNYLEQGQMGVMPVPLIILAHYVEDCGAGAMSQFEALAVLADQMRATVHTERRFPKIQEKIMQGTTQLEQRMTTERYSQDDRAYVYRIVTDVLQAAPSLCADFIDLFSRLKPAELKSFVRDILPLYRAQLAIMARNESKNDEQTVVYAPRDLVWIRNNLKQLPVRAAESNFATACQQTKQDLLDSIQQNFRDRFGIIKVPDQFSADHIRVLTNCALYLGNMAHREEVKERKLSWYLALVLNNKWQEFRAGQAVDPTQYLRSDVAIGTQDFITERQRLLPITAETVGVATEQWPEYQKTLQEEVTEVMVGDIETIDIKLHNVVSNLESLIDPDLYPDPLDKLRLELLLKYGNQTINAAVIKLREHIISPDVVSPLTSVEFEVQERIRASLPKIEDLTPTYLKQHWQEGIKPLALVTNTLAFCQERNIATAIQTLQQSLVPGEDIIKIFNRLGEEFTPASGARAMTQDLDYLDKFIVKREDSLTPDELTVLRNYTQAIRAQLIDLQSHYDQLVKKFQTMRTDISTVKNLTLQERLQAIKGIIQDSDQQKVIVSTMTNDLNVIIENIRECLSCARQGCNNDTDLTFGDSNKFFIYSRTESQNKGSVADQIVFLEPVTWNDTTQPAFVLDRLYGSRTSTILQNHVATVLKKCFALKRKFPGQRVAIFVTGSALSTAGLSADQLVLRLHEQFPEKITCQTVEQATVDVATSAAADHYIEFGGGSRQAGPRLVNGVMIQVV